MSKPTAPVKTYTGHGQSGVWTDPNNWSNGAVAGVGDTAIVTSNAVLNGSIEAYQIMFLGNETITINGALKTDSANTCDGVMVCDQAVATFEAGSTLNCAGGFVTGQDTVGTTYIDGASGGKAAATINNRVLRVGEDSGSHGVLNVAGILNNGVGYVGMGGNGVMNVTGSGQVNFTGDLIVGDLASATGAMNLSGNAAVTAANVDIGKSISGAPGGTGTVTVGAGTTLTSGSVYVNHGSALVMAGGTVAATDGNGFQVNAGGTVSGYGHISAVNDAVIDNGALSATGGKLTITGNLIGMGTVQIGADSTLDVIAGKIGVPSISFMGGNATLDLTTGVTGAFNIAGFAAGDQIVMQGIDAVNWNGTNDILTLSEQGQAMSRLHLSDVPDNAVFHVNQESAGSVITLMPSH